MTFSLVARCKDTGMFGVAVSSSSPAVAARCAHARAGAGAVASQNVTDPALGTRALDLLALGADAAQAIAVLQSSTQHLQYRQLLAVDSNGRSAIYSGTAALGTVAEAQTDNVASAGNLLANTDIAQAIVDYFVSSNGHLGDRLIGALRAALKAGGEAGPVHSAGMLLVDRVSWPVAELRCDWSDDCPIEHIARAWEVYQPQMDDYVKRALNPGDAPSYGVPGDE